MGLRGAGAKKLVASKSQPTHWGQKRYRVARINAFLQSLPITKGILAGQNLRLLRGQRKFIKDVYGDVAKDGRRRVKLAIKSEPRGNGKTGFIAGLALCHLLGPESEMRGEIYSCAYSKQQAALIFAEMKAILDEKDPSYAD